jgi:hypothetical protein
VGSRATRRYFQSRETHKRCKERPVDKRTRAFSFAINGVGKRAHRCAAVCEKASEGAIISAKTPAVRRGRPAKKQFVPGVAGFTTLEDDDGVITSRGLSSCVQRARNRNSERERAALAEVTWRPNPRP